MKGLKNKIAMNFAWSLIRKGLSKSEALKMAWSVLKNQNALLSGTLKVKGTTGEAIIDMNIEWPEQIYWNGPKIIGTPDDNMLQTIIAVYTFILSHITGYWTSKPGATIKNMALDLTDSILEDLKNQIKLTQYTIAC